MQNIYLADDGGLEFANPLPRRFSTAEGRISDDGVDMFGKLIAQGLAKMAATGRITDDVSLKDAVAHLTAAAVEHFLSAK
jgi:hypothetical protein